MAHKIIRESYEETSSAKYVLGDGAAKQAKKLRVNVGVGEILLALLSKTEQTTGSIGWRAFDECDVIYGGCFSILKEAYGVDEVPRTNSQDGVERFTTRAGSDFELTVQNLAKVLYVPKIGDLNSSERRRYQVDTGIVALALLNFKPVNGVSRVMQMLSGLNVDPEEVKKNVYAAWGRGETDK